MSTSTEQKPKKKHRLRNIVLGIVALIVLIIIISSMNNRPASSPSGTSAPASASAPAAAAPAAPAGHSAVYEVTSDGKTANSISYMTVKNGNVGQEQANGAALPFKKSVDFDPKGGFAYNSFTLTAQAGQDATKISCKITVDGEVKAEQTSSGQYAVVTCNAQ